MSELKYAQDLLKKANSHQMGGFNCIINGHGEPKAHEYGDKGEFFDRIQGHHFAADLARENGIAFVYPFRCGGLNCRPFEYGGSFVCNSCENSGVDKDWWKIQVEKDGNAFCCHGLDFVDLQESENYAFGDTFEDAIENYGKLMIA